MRNLLKQYLIYLQLLSLPECLWLGRFLMFSLLVFLLHLFFLFNDYSIITTVLSPFLSMRKHNDDFKLMTINQFSNIDFICDFHLDLDVLLSIPLPV